MLLHKMKERKNPFRLSQTSLSSVRLFTGFFSSKNDLLFHTFTIHILIKTDVA